jgi:hypothetical protein
MTLIQTIKNIFIPTTWSSDIISVRPSKLPIGKLFYMDYIYKTPQEYLRKERRKKLNRLNRLLKLKYIDKILKNN